MRAALQLVTTPGLLDALYQRPWPSAPVVLAIMLLMLAPAALGRQQQVSSTPAEFEVLMVVFVFAVAVGALRAVFEFDMNQILGTNMPKPMFADVSGLTATMWNLIVDALGGIAFWVPVRAAPHSRPAAPPGRRVSAIVMHRPQVAQRRVGLSILPARPVTC